MPNLFESAERLYKRLSGSNQRFNRKTDSRSNDGTTVSSNAATSDKSGQWRNYNTRASSSANLTTPPNPEEDDYNWAPHAPPRMPQPPGDLTAVSSESEYEEVEDSNSTFKYDLGY